MGDLVTTNRAADLSAGAEEAAESHLTARPSVQEWLWRYVPALDSLRHYSLRTLRLDAVAGLTVAAVAVPQAMAYATVAGLPPEYGLYTAIVMTAVGALFDSSRQLINGPTNAISIALLSALTVVPESERVPAAMVVALMVGLIQMGITLLRLGDMTRYVSHAVIVGFTLGAAVLLVLDQLKNLLGLKGMGHSDDHFLIRFWRTLTEGGPVHPLTVAVGAGTVALVLGLRWLNRRSRVRVPEFLTALVLLSVLAWYFKLDEKGVKVVGDIPAHLPGLAPPTLEWGHVRALAGSSLAIAVLGLLEALAMAKAIAAQTRQKLDINQQCLSEGLANIAGSFFHCMPGSGSLTRSTINQQAGAVTQWSGVFSAIAVAATVLLFRPLAEYLAPLPYYIPRAALAGILVVSAWRLVDRRQLVYHLRATRFDMGIVLITAVAAVAVSVEFCILIGVFLSFVLYVPRAAQVQFTELTLTPERVLRERLPEDPSCGRIFIYNIEGELFFGSAPDLEENFAAIVRRVTSETRVVVLRLKRARNPDAVCLERIAEFLRQMEERRVRVLLCGVRRDLARVLRTTGIEARLGATALFLEPGNVGSSTLDAVRHAYELLGGDVCATCPRRDEAAGSRESWYYMI